MSAAKIFTEKADACLRQAAGAGDMNERSRLISEAAAWDMKAQEARDPGAASFGTCLDLADDEDAATDFAP